MAPNKFDITKKQLLKAKPCVVMLIRDAGVEWYENCKAGQLLEITTGNQKAYINLDYNKLLNLNVNTPEGDIDNAINLVKEIEKERDEFNKDTEKKTRDIFNEIQLLEEQEKYINPNEKNAEKKLTKLTKKVNKNTTHLDKRIDQLKSKYVKLSKERIKNFGTNQKPILGFVCYEKEFNALPYKPEHDSKSITQWLDDVLKNKKDFKAQRTEAFGKLALWILLGLGALAFVFFKWGQPFIESLSKETVESGVKELGIIIPIISKRWLNWLLDKKRE